MPARIQGAINDGCPMRRMSASDAGSDELDAASDVAEVPQADIEK
jgi:hypothetical protein